MIPIDKLVQYTRLIPKIRFPQNPDEPYLIVHFSENSSFIEDYPKLGIKPIDVRHVVVPITKVPRTRMTSNLRKVYQQMKLRPFTTKMRFPQNKNIFLDLSLYVNAVDTVYKPKTYRQRAGFLLMNALFRAFATFPDNYNKVLMYTVDMTKGISNFQQRKIFPLLLKMKAEDVFFDQMLLTTLDQNSARHRLLVKDGDYKLQRVISYLRKLKPITTEEDQDEEIDRATDTIVQKIDPENQKVFKSSVKTMLQNDPDTLEKVVSDETTPEGLKRVAATSVLYKVSGNMDRSKRLADKMSGKILDKALKAIPKTFKDEMLEKQPTINQSDSVVSQASNVANLIDKKTPEHIFDKRRIDFETNLKKDMANAFKVLEGKDIPLKFENVSISDKPQRSGEINKSDIAVVGITLKDKFGKSHRVKIEIPKIDPKTGTFRVNGKKKCMINQIVLNPISFPEPYDSKFESSYSAFHIYSKRSRKNKYLEAYMGSFRLPLLILLSYSFGLEETLKRYKISYKIVDKKPSKDKTFSLIPSSYIVFEGLDSDLKREMAESFVQAKVTKYNIEKEFGTKEYFNDLIIAITGRIDATYHINNNLENIVDPVVRQVLINQQLPSTLPDIIQYMTTKVVTGFVQDRNDLTNQRIRNSEILVHLAQKELLKAYTQYRQQVLAGNEQSIFEMPTTKVLTQFTNLEIVQNMEYANPIEEMATITKVSPVGKSVGGIPDKRAINLDARNTHPTYYGNIDPLDTAEGGNIGITQQLTVDAFITSARGLFSAKEMKDTERSGILSTSTAMVPFVESNEGARIIMSANQAKQMLPLKNPEAPIVQSGYESTLANVLSDAFIKRSPCAGKIVSITESYIDIICGSKKQRIDISPMPLKSGSGKDTLSTFKPVVAVKQSVKKDQIIAEGACMSQGTISLGRNLATCYMPYKGYNFEDGLVISETLVNDQKLTSLHGVEEDMTVEAGDKILVIADVGQTHEKGEIIFSKAMGELEEILGSLEDEDDDLRDVYDGKKILKSPGGKIVDIEVFSNIPPEDQPKLAKFIEKTNKKYKKPAKEKWVDRNVPIKGALVRFKIEQELTIGLGDKLCNRFGNKGIISLIEKEEFMPRTPWGERAEIILNPLGVVGRMNMGQIFELYCGLISREMANRIGKAKNKSEVVTIFSKVFPYLDSSKDKSYAKKMVNNIAKLSTAQFNKMVNQIRTSKSVPIIVPPFKAPHYSQIAQALKMLGLKTGYKMALPEFGVKTANEVPFGYIYISKLEHLGALKIHSRSTGPTTGKTGQPTAGKSRGGGQRMGEGDTWALLSYNCPTILSEFFGPMSDDVVSKKEMEAEIIQNGATSFKETRVSPTKDLLNSYFIALMLGT
jgi:DNA-directed RNA polymerase beta subunit